MASSSIPSPKCTSCPTSANTTAIPVSWHMGIISSPAIPAFSCNWFSICFPRGDSSASPALCMASVISADRKWFASIHISFTASTTLLTLRVLIPAPFIPQALSWRSPVPPVYIHPAPSWSSARHPDISGSSEDGSEKPSAPLPPRYSAPGSCRHNEVSPAYARLCVLPEPALQPLSLPEVQTDRPHVLWAGSMHAPLWPARDQGWPGSLRPHTMFWRESPHWQFYRKYNLLFSFPYLLPAVAAYDLSL